MVNWLRVEELVRLAEQNVVAGCAKPGNVTNDELRAGREQLLEAVRLLDER